MPVVWRVRQSVSRPAEGAGEHAGRDAPPVRGHREVDTPARSPNPSKDPPGPANRAGSSDPPSLVHDASRRAFIERRRPTRRSGRPSRRSSAWQKRVLRGPLRCARGTHGPKRTPRGPNLRRQGQPRRRGPSHGLRPADMARHTPASREETRATRRVATRRGRHARG